MKTKDLQAQKERYFAAHWGQEVFSHKDYNSVSRISTGAMMTLMYNGDGYCLRLKPLSEITDEEALTCWSNDNYKAGYSDIEHTHRLFLNITRVNADFLRKRGYAVDFEDKSVDELIELGWLKLAI